MLNDKDFEHLVRDLLQAELQIHFEGFKSGKDGGSIFDILQEQATKKP